MEFIIIEDLDKDLNTEYEELFNDDEEIFLCAVCSYQLTSNSDGICNACQDHEEYKIGEYYDREKIIVVNKHFINLILENKIDIYNFNEDTKNNCLKIIKRYFEIEKNRNYKFNDIYWKKFIEENKIYKEKLGKKVFSLKEIDDFYDYFMDKYKLNNLILETWCILHYASDLVDLF